MASAQRMPPFVQGLAQTQSAVTYAEQMHAGQRRADGTSFILHPLEVASLLYYAGAPDHLIAAGVIHDLLEKTDANAADLQERFGPRITGLVLAVSDDDQIAGYTNRKAALRQQVAGAGADALTLFAADKLSKLRELHRETAADNGDSTTPGRVRQLRARRLRHYQRSLALLEERLPDLRSCANCATNSQRSHASAWYSLVALSNGPAISTVPGPPPRQRTPRIPCAT